MKKEFIDGLLKFDPLSEAEKITGKDCRSDKKTIQLGFGLLQASNEMKNELLDEMEDSKFRETVDDYLKIVKSIGFELVLVEPFVSKGGVEENFYILWHSQYGILLSFDSFTHSDDGSWAKSGEEVPPPSVNGGSFYYNIKLHEKENRDWSITSNGSFYNNSDENSDENSNVFIGSHDCREAIKYKINRLAENGEFLPKWIERPFLWLLHYGEKNDSDDYKKINEEKISRLPKHVIEAITTK